MTDSIQFLSIHPTAFVGLALLAIIARMLPQPRPELQSRIRRALSWAAAGFLLTALTISAVPAAAIPVFWAALVLAAMLHDRSRTHRALVARRLRLPSAAIHV